MTIRSNIKAIIVIGIVIIVAALIYLLSTDSYTQAKFRTMQDPIQTQEKVDLTGLREIQASGGPILQIPLLKKQLQGIDKKIIIIDSMSQYHGYLSNQLLTEMPTTFFGYDRETDIRHWIRRLFLTFTLDIPKNLVVSESDIAKKYGFGYQNLIIDSRIKTPDKHVDKFVTFIESVPEDVWLHFHCRLGKGRTSISLVMLDIMKNAPHVALKDIVNRQHLLGSENLFNTVARHGGSYLSSTLLKRKKFIEDFYAFISQRKAGGIQQWSDWRNTKKS